MYLESIVEQNGAHFTCISIYIFGTLQICLSTGTNPIFDITVSTQSTSQSPLICCA